MKSVRANGLSFSYLEEGSGPLVLLLHGFPDTAHSWDQVRPALAAAGYRAVSPFMRGYAPTEIPARPDYDSDTLGRDALALIEALGEKSAILVGHDWGASAAYSAAGLGAERIRFLVTLAIPHPAALKPTPTLLWRSRHFLTLKLPGAAARIRRGSFQFIDEIYQRWSPGWKVPASETDEVKKSLREPGSLEAAIGYYQALRPTLPAGQRVKITVPAAAFAGLDDELVPPDQYDRAASRYLSRYQVIRMPGSHFMHRQHPQIFIAKLLELLRSQASAAPK